MVACVLGPPLLKFPRYPAPVRCLSLRTFDPFCGVLRAFRDVGIAVLLLACLCLTEASAATVRPGTVYLVVGSDTAIWEGLDLTRYHCHFKPDLYTSPTQNAYRVMDPNFRARFKDSFGTPIRLTWWSLVGGLNRPADNSDAPIANLMPLYLLKKYHGESMRLLGDEQATHYHTFFWSDYNHDGKFWWNEAKTFLECSDDFDVALAQSFLEEGLFPVSFRSGWHFMDNDWQRRLNELLPFSLHCASPIKLSDLTEPLENNYDWSKATTTFVPFHPSPTNYQTAGDGSGWNVRSIKMPSLTQKVMNATFAEAEKGIDQVACFWAHLPEVPFLDDIAKVDAIAHVAATNYPTVQFRYCTAVEAMQRWMKTTDLTPPRLEVLEVVDGDRLTLAIEVDEPIFQPQPVVAFKDLCQHYRLLKPESVGPKKWRITLPGSRSQIAKVGIAVTDPSGNLTTRILRYIPDDVYVDNLDSGYAELSGTWTNSTAASWGVDSRRASIDAGEVATARWVLPVAESRSYSVWLQAPGTTNSVGHLRYTLQSAGNTLAMLDLSAALPPRQWVLLAETKLEAGAETFVELVAESSDVGGRSVVADVVKLTPLPFADDFISDVHVEAFGRAATVFWKTAKPSTGFVLFGKGADLDSVSTTNALPSLEHAVALMGLSVSTDYQCQIVSDAGAVVRRFPCGVMPPDFIAFRTSGPPAPIPLFDYAQVWKYSPANLEGVTWQAFDFDDRAWASGPGLLWVDTRTGGPNPSVANRRTEMPFNLKDKLPYVTYYARTRFSYLGDPNGAELVFTNYLDDGAVFYLNGIEIHRENMAAAPAPIANATLASDFSCSGDATCAVVFRVSGKDAIGLRSGENVLAVEIHNYAAGSADITFGCALSIQGATARTSFLRATRRGSDLWMNWEPGAWRLQESIELAEGGAWHDVAGDPESPYRNPDTATATARKFFRLVARSAFP